MIPFTESLRYEYPLTPDSIVIDAGGYEGNFAKIIAEKYGCKVFVFEPVREHFENIQKMLDANPAIAALVRVLPAGLGADNRREEMGVKGDQSGIACFSANRSEEVEILGIAGVLLSLAGMDRQIDLLKLNIEGMEYEVLEAILDLGLDHRFNHIQVQFHNHIPNAEKRRDFIKNRLLLNHRITWDDPWIWTGFSLK